MQPTDTAIATVLLKAKEVAAYLGVNMNTLAHWRSKGHGPQWVRLSNNSVRYPANQLAAWVASQTGKQITHNPAKEPSHEQQHHTQ